MPFAPWRAAQTTETAGVGTLVLNAAPAWARSFRDAYGTTARTGLFCLSWATGFEMFLGTFDGGSPGTLARNTVYASSNGGALVTLPAGTKDVFSWIEPSGREVMAINATASATSADMGNLVVFTGSALATFNLPSISAVVPGASLLFRNSGTATLVLDPSGSETINGVGTLAINAGFSAEIFALPTGWTALVSAPASFGRNIGEIFALATPTLPPLCLVPNGQLVGRAAYSALFTAIGTTYGAGDGTSTFAVPDCRGRAIFFLDNLGGVTAAARLTSAVSGIDGAVLGAAGGDQRPQVHNHGVNDAGHNHGVNDPGHGHGVSDPGHSHSLPLSGGGQGHGGLEPIVAEYGSGGTGGSGTGIGIYPSGSNISLYGSGANVSIQNAFAGGSGNVPPGIVMNAALFAGA